MFTLTAPPAPAGVPSPRCLICGKAYRERASAKGQPRLTCSRRCSLVMWNVLSSCSETTARRLLCQRLSRSGKRTDQRAVKQAGEVADYAAARRAKRLARQIVTDATNTMKAVKAHGRGR